MKNYKLETMCGNDINTVAEKARAIAKEKGVIVEFDFNEIKCLVSDKTVTEWLVRDYMNAHIMAWKTIGPDCKIGYDPDTEIELRTRQLERAKRWKKTLQEQKAKDDAEQKIFEKKVKGVELELKEEAAWNKSRENNTDPYGKAALDYAEMWAKLMQIEIAKGKTVKECAKETQNGLDYLGITGFMYGCAVSILSQTWEHGEDLRKWHNKEYGVSEDKEGVVNPAVLTVG